MDYIYKILTREQWKILQDNGEFLGAPVDLEDGYIHFSAAHQVAQTAAKHFAGMQDLRLLSVATAILGSELKWEISRGGEPFPHLYRPLKLCEVHEVHEIQTTGDGSHDFSMVC